MSEYFIGEIELTSDRPKNDDFLDFGFLPLKKQIEIVAEKHKDFLELMPYQKQGEAVQLVVSVYLKKTELIGRVIVVLLRADYPDNIDTLREFIKTALKRFQASVFLKNQFDHASVNFAECELEKLLQEI
ncbi:MAG: hypothetical protein WC831_00975 [Parcubacteria group bacterium]|jgi:hypothetical protein